MTNQKVNPLVHETIDQIPAGAHICQIFSDDDEYNEVLLKLLLNCLKLGNCAACLSKTANEREINHFLNRHDLSYGELIGNGAFILSDSREIYFKDNLFDSDQTIDFISRYYQESMELGFSDAWLMSEIPSEIQNISCGNRLIEYEYRLGLLLDDYPIISVCQYDARYFDEPTVSRILNAHPYIVIQGIVVRNPSFSHLFEHT
jgi:hypothetical protein